ncbi:LLM class flavin-dependent oxidoreductase [Mycolicibacterium sp. BiH015]|uniref:LLM class flavin-dependent oxidoreductase n=1 Tax=Mycolicibacterium sp. BiH015 TaxID=3018808 RepID=UPI003FA53A1E
MFSTASLPTTRSARSTSRRHREACTLLAALAGATTGLRLGVLFTSNRFRLPALLAKIATTVDIVSEGRLNFGIGAGSRSSVPIARRKYEAHG